MQLTLSDIAQLINMEQVQLDLCLSKSLRHARQIGEYLHEGKKIAKHGAWQAWVKRDCQLALTTATNYIRIYEHWDLLIESADLTDLGITSALNIIRYRTKPTVTAAKTIRKRSIAWIDNAHRNALDYPTPDELRTVLKAINEELEYLIGLGWLTIATGDIPVMMSELEKIEKRIDDMKAVINEFVLNDPSKF